MATREEKIALIQDLKQQGLGRTEIKAKLLAMDQPQAAKTLPGITPEKFTPAENPTAFQAAFPRATATGEQSGQGLSIGRKISGGIADLASLPGRTLASAGGSSGGKEGTRPAPKRDFSQAELAKTKGTGGIEDIIRSPSTGASVAAIPFTGGSSLGLIGRGLAEGAAGALGTQAEKFAEEGKISPVGALGETALGGVVPGLGKGVAPAAKLGRKILGRTAEGLTGVSEEALTKFGTGLGKGATSIRKAAGTQKQIADDLLNKLDNIDEFLPNSQEVTQILESSPAISTENIIKTLESAKTKGAVGSGKGANSKIDELIADIQAQGPELSAVQFRALRQQFDREIGDQFGKESSAFISAIKNARNTAKNDLLDNTPAEFAEAMKAYTEKLSVAERLKGELGKTAATREGRAEQFISSIFGANKSVRRQKLQEFQDIFGGDFLDDAKLAQLAAQLGPEGEPGLLPRSFTGRSGLGVGGGFALGNIPGAVIGAGASSPRIAAGTLGGLDFIGEQATKLAPGAAKAGEALRRGLQRAGAEQFRSK